MTIKHPDTYKNTKLYSRLVQMNDAEMISKVDKLIQNVEPRLLLTGREAFDNFTLHDAKHSLNLLGIAGDIIADDTLKSLSSVEIGIMIYSFYLHDLGMALSYADSKRIYESDDFINFLDSHPEYSGEIGRLKKKNEQEGNKVIVDKTISDLYHAALTEYIRPNHATEGRYNAVFDEIEKNFKDAFEYKGVSFKDQIMLICKSHNEKTYSLMDADNGTKLYDPETYVSGCVLNMQFCAAVLRLADILDFDNERVPKSLFSAIGLTDKKMPGYKISLDEWQKQMAVHTINIESDALTFSATCTSPSIEHALRQMCDGIEKEIRDTLNVLNDNKSQIANNYKLSLPLVVTPKIKSSGYVYRDYSIKLNERAIIQLLMGDNLYSKPQVAIRELLQNAIDACRVRKTFESSYTPLIKVDKYCDEEGSVWVRVADNGIGMDNYVLSKYFFEIGKSYYNSVDFKSTAIKYGCKDFMPISKFGIGFLSVFMIGELVRVTTQNKLSKYNDNKLRTLLVDGTNSLAIVKESAGNQQGTTIEVKLKKEFAEETHLRSLFGYIKETFIRPEIPLLLDFNGDLIEIKEEEFLQQNKSYVASLSSYGIIPVELDFSKYSSFLRGKAFFYFFKTDSGQLSYVDEKGICVWGNDPLKLAQLFKNKDHCNLVTVNGISMRLKKIGSLFNYKRKIMSYVVDIDIPGNENVVYDVSRQNIIGKGLNYVREEIIRCTKLHLETTGYYAQLTKDTIDRFKKAEFKFKSHDPLNKELLLVVEKVCPEGTFGLSAPFIKDIANKLELDTDEVKPYLHAILQKRKKD